jgi:cytochrome c peroxidase
MIRVCCVLILVLLSAHFIAGGAKGKLTPYKFPQPLAFPEMPVAVDNPVTYEGAELGRFLFYDPVLSADSTISCSTCHQQKFAFSDGGIQFSRGIRANLQKRNTPGLFNLAWYPALFWDGRANSVEDQVFFPVRDHAEMGLDWQTAANRIKSNRRYRKKFLRVFGTTEIDSTHISKAIAQFERTLISYNSKFDRVLMRMDQLNEKELRGYEIMNDQSMADCLHCHSSDANALTTSLDFSNNGLDAISDPALYADAGRGAITGDNRQLGHFKVPSLRNIALTAPYMHDGRFKTLGEVIRFYSSGVNSSATIDSKMTRVHEGGVHLSDHDKQCLEAFLLTLTDSVFISNPEFSNPFE